MCGNLAKPTTGTWKVFTHSIFLPYVSRIGRFFPLECIYGNYIICFSVRCVRRLKCSEACDELIKRRGEPAWKRLPHNSQDIDCKKFLTLKNLFTGVHRQCKKRKVNSSKNLHVVFEWQMHLIFSLLQPQKFNILIIANPSGLAVGQRGLELDTQFKIFCLISPDIGLVSLSPIWFSDDTRITRPGNGTHGLFTVVALPDIENCDI